MDPDKLYGPCAKSHFVINANFPNPCKYYFEFGSIVAESPTTRSPRVATCIVARLTNAHVQGKGYRPIQLKEAKAKSKPRTQKVFKKDGQGAFAKHDQSGPGFSTASQNQSAREERPE